MMHSLKKSNDSSLNDELRHLIKTLTHTGEKKLDPVVLKKITKICKKSNEYVIFAYHLLMEHLAKKHSEVRFSAFQLCHELFRRSHCFRELMVAILQRVLELTAETNASAPLPPPKAAATELRKLALSTISEWCKEYGSGYKKLNLAISFLKQCKKVDLNAMAQEQAAEQNRQEECERRKKAIYSEHYKKTLVEIVEKRPDVVSTVTELETCISLLLPTPDSFFIEEDLEETSETVISSSSNITKDKTSNNSGHEKKHDTSKDESGTESDDEVPRPFKKAKIFDFRKYGIINPQIGLKLNLDIKNNPIIKETEENRDIIQNAREAYKLLQGKYNTSLDKWIATINKYIEVSGDSGNADVTSLTRLKERLATAVTKYDQLNLGSLNSDKAGYESDDSTSDSDFEEVEGKAGYEEFAKSAPVAADQSTVLATKPKKRCKKDWSLLSEENNELDPTTALSTLKSKKQQKPANVKEGKETGRKDEESGKEDEDLGRMDEQSGKGDKDSGGKNEELGKKNKESGKEDKGLGRKNEQSGKEDKESGRKNEKLGKEDKEPEKEDEESGEEDEEPVAGPSGIKRKSEKSDRKSKLLSIAPKLPFDIDLYHWEDEKITAPTILSVKPDTHRFWSSAAEELEDVLAPDGEAALRTRVIEFAGEFEPVKWSCRAPLPSGKLCPRKDRIKCPLHGPIIGRDKTGVPTDPADRETEKQKEAIANAGKAPDWQDPKLLAQLKESTGVDLRMPDRGKRGWRKRLPSEQESNYVGLTDINAVRNTTKRRLSKKLFSRSSMRRVAEDMNKQDRKKFHDKYGDQFNYVFEHS